MSAILSDDRSYVSSLGTLTSHSVQSAWIGILERRGIRWASLAETLRVKEERGLVGGGVSDEFAGWARRLVLKTRPTDVQIPLLSALHKAIHAFAAIDEALEEENGWTVPTMALFEAVFEGSKGLVSNLNRDMADQVLRVLSLADLRKVKPDFLIGLCRKSIRIALNAHSKALDRDVKQYIATRSCLVLYEIANIEGALHYYSYFFGELKGPSGSAGEARIQNCIACYVSLCMHMHLARLALSADPASFRRPTDVMRRVYGLQTGGGGGAWKLVMMWAEKGKGDGDQEVEQDTGGLGAEPAGEPLEEDLRLTTCTVITLWLGNVLDPTDLLSLIPILRSIRDELDERHDLIGNWLYCLRDRVLVPSTTRIKQKAGAGPSLGKRERGANEGGAESKGDRKDSATANERTGAGGGHRLMVNLDRTSSVRTWVRAVSSSGSW